MTPEARPPTIWPRLVGAFVVLQLVFLLVSNVLTLAQRVAPGPVTQTLAAIPRPYAQATGQLQGWSLFAPNVPRRAAFVFTELRWPDGRRVYMKSDHMPDNFKHFYRPFGTGRLLQYELHLRLLPLTYDPQDVADHPDEWRQIMIEEVRNRHRPMQAYLNWRLNQYREEFPRANPTELVLQVQVIDLPRHGTGEKEFIGPRVVPLVRWRPQETPPPEWWGPRDVRPGRPEGCLPVEMYDLPSLPQDPKMERFLWVPAKDEP